jgi:predicted phosphodiesterase
MTTIAIFGDIHANLSALTAVLADMDARQLSTRYCLGDLVGYATFPNEVTELIRASQIPTLMGNYDQGVGNDSDDCGCAYTTDADRERGERSIAWTNQQTTAENKAFLRALVPQIHFQLGRWQVLLVHGSPRKINEYLFIERSDDSLKRLFDNTNADVLVCGHTHLPYHRLLPSGRQVINAGSVGKPKDKDPRAGYVILQATDSELRVEFVRVPYDIEKTARAIEASTLPPEFASMLRNGG